MRCIFFVFALLVAVTTALAQEADAGQINRKMTEIRRIPIGITLPRQKKQMKLYNSLRSN
jgi:hypothetical protein